MIPKPHVVAVGLKASLTDCMDYLTVTEIYVGFHSNSTEPENEENFPVIIFLSIQKN